MAMPAESAQQSGGKHTLSCYQCRARKLKCDRLMPCTRCTQSGVECQFPASRQRPTYAARRPRVKELEARLVTLEHRFGQEQGAAPQPPALPQPRVQLVGTGRVEALPPQSVIHELTSLYFARLYPVAPMQHPERYLTSLHLPPHMQPPMCLQYAILALAAALSRAHERLALPFYHRARNYVQLDEMRDDGQDILTIGHAQCWLLLSHFEGQRLWFPRASLSVSRSFRLAQMMGLCNVEDPNPRGMTLPPPRDTIEKEERRRTMWAIFCSDRLTSSTTNWPVLFDVRRIKTLLPVSEDSFRQGLVEPSFTLHQALRDHSIGYPHFACRVLAAHLFHECLDHVFGNVTDDGSVDADKTAFWSRHHSLDNRLAAMFMGLPDSLHCPGDVENPDAIFLNLKLHAATICIHRAAVAEMERDGEQRKLLGTVALRCKASALEIFTIIATLDDADALFMYSFVAFAAFMASTVFLEDYVASHDRQSEERLITLMNFMLLMSKRNPITASLTVQLAREMHKNEVDKSALEKVQDLVVGLDPNVPLLGKTDRDTGEILFCPLQPR